VRDGLTLNIDYIVDHAHGEMERGRNSVGTQQIFRHRATVFFELIVDVTVLVYLVKTLLFCASSMNDKILI
jgi:hypothetical protein